MVQGEVQRVALDMLPPPVRPKGWTIRLERIGTAQIEHANMPGFDIDMLGGASFGMVKQMRGGPWQILPSTFDLTAMRVSRDGHDFLRNGSASGRFEIDSHRREETSGLATLALTDAALRVQGELAGMRFDVDSSGHWTPGFAKDDLQGRLNFDLHWQRGWFAYGGKFDVEVPMQVTSAAEQVIAEASLHTRFETDGMHLDLDVPAPPKHPGSIHANLIYAQTDATLPTDAQAALARRSGTLALNWRFASLDWLGQALVKEPWLRFEVCQEMHWIEIRRHEQLPHSLEDSKMDPLGE